jgi:hypothetical protein
MPPLEELLAGLVVKGDLSGDASRELIRSGWICPAFALKWPRIVSLSNRETGP